MRPGVLQFLHDREWNNDLIEEPWKEWKQAKKMQRTNR
jgi:hypothetical protein